MRARRVGFAIAGLALALIAGAAWLASSDPDGGGHSGDVTSTAGARAEVHDSSEGVPAVPDGGPRGVSGHVLEQRAEVDAPAPAAGAQVDVYELAAMPGGGRTCEDCGADLIWCDAPTSAHAVLALAHAHGARPGPIASTRTDAAGRFAFDELPPGRLQLVATTPLGSRSVELTPDEELELVIEAGAPPRLTVRTEDGSPLPELAVTLISIATGEVREAPVGRDGRVSLEGVSGETWAGVEAPGWLPVGTVLDEGTELILQRPRTLVVHTRLAGKPVDADVEVLAHGAITRRTRSGELRLGDLGDVSVAVRAFNAELSSESVAVELGDRETEITLELRRAVSLDVGITGADGAPPEGTWVGLSSAGGQSYEPKVLEDGYARFEGVPEGEYTLDVRASRCVKFFRQVDLVPGANDVQVTLRPASFVRGVVVSAAGKPVGRAEVSLQTEVAASSDITMSNDEGAFEFEVAGGGRVTVDAWSSEAGRGAATGQVGEPLTVRLSPGGVLEVELIDVDGKRLSELVQVRSAMVPAGRFGHSGDPFGRIAGLEPGSWILSVDLPGRLSVEQPFEIVADQVRRVTVRLSEGETIDGQVLEADGKPVRDAQVTGVANSTAISDEQGRFHIRGAPQGPVHLLAFASDSNRTASASVEAPAQGVVLRFDPTFRVTGGVVGDGDKPITRFVVEGSWVNDARGHFELALSAGEHSVYADGHLPGSIEVTKDGDVGVVRLEPTKVLRGEVVADGRPVPGAAVRLVETYEQATTDAAGRFELSAVDLSSGTVHLTASRGALSGQAEAILGGPPVRVSLSRGTHVRGRVVDEAGNPRPTTLELVLGQEEALRTDASTDAQGRFEVDLLPGQWSISPRGAARRMFTISGASQEVTVLDSGRCAISLAPGDVHGTLWLVPPVVLGPVDWNTGQGLPPGSVVVSELDAPEGSAVPCGAWELVGVSDGHVHKKPVTLEPGVVARVHLEGNEPPAPE